MIKLTIFLISFFLIASTNAQEVNEKLFIEQDQDLVLAPPLTASDGQFLMKEAKQRRIKKTINRYIPNVIIVSQLGDSLKLTELITKKTYISFSGFHCGFGTEHIQTVFPEILECSYYNEDCGFVLLVGIDSSSYILSEKSKEDLDWNLYYFRDRSNVFFISFEEAKKLNFFSQPSHMITTADGQVMRFETGLKEVDYWMDVIDSE